MAIDESHPDPIRLALSSLRSAPGALALLAPPHRAAVLEAQQQRRRFPFLVLEEAWRLAQRPGADGVQVLRGHFEAQANHGRREGW